MSLHSILSVTEIGEAIMNGTFGQAKSAEIYLYNNSECSKSTILSTEFQLCIVSSLVIINASFGENSYISKVNGTLACSSNSNNLLCRLTDEECGKCGEFALCLIEVIIIHPIMFMSSYNRMELSGSKIMSIII